MNDILRAARHDRRITSATLRDQLARRAISEWRHLESVRWGSLDQWEQSMTEATAELERLENQKARAAARRAAA